MEPNVEKVSEYLRTLQGRISIVLEAEELRGRFMEDTWESPEGGGGVTRVLSEGQLFEQAAVNFSHVRGATLPQSASEQRPELAGRSFEAVGLSLIIHPRSPFIPTTHMNLRLFLASGETPVWWFGGGLDLTPYYPYREDVVSWHRQAQGACEPFGADIYPRFKRQCDEYFYLPHRGEARGVGGLLFDDLASPDFDTCFQLVRSIGEAFLPAYLPIVQRRRDHAWGERERQFQLYRRGRYVEFNLLYDRGTLFGLQAGGRTESILVSMPPQATWRYDWHPQPESREAELADYLKPQEWLG